MYNTGIKEKWELVSSRTARRSFATNLVKKGANIRAVQMLLGHSSVSVTEKYILTDATDFDVKNLILGDVSEQVERPERLQKVM